MSAWLNYCRDSQRTSADPDGNITALIQQWVKYGGSDSKNGWAGGAIADADFVYYFYTNYNINYGGTGDKFSMRKYDRNGNIIWTNLALGGHNTRKMWPAKVGNYVLFHDYKYLRVDSATGLTAGGYHGGDSYGSIANNAGETKIFSGRVSANEGFLGRIWVKGHDVTVFPNLSNNNGQLWVRNEPASGETVTDNNKFNTAYDNGKVFYNPKYTVISSTTWNYPSGVYCWDEAGVLQWSVATSPLQQSAMSVGNNRIYLFEDNSLVARNQSDGSVSWSALISGTVCQAQAPVHANGLVIIATSTGIYAYNGTTGAVAWTSAIAGMTFGDPNHTIKYTVLAAALTSNTLVATAAGGIYILSLTDGSQVQLYNPPAITAGQRAVNPIIVGNRVYVTVTLDAFTTTWPQALICLESGGAPPPPADTTPPSAPGDPTFSSVTHNSMTVSWGLSIDNVAVSSYKLYWRQPGGALNVIDKTTRTHNLTGLMPDTVYEFYVVAVDSSGNLSAASGTTTRTTLPEPIEPPPPDEPPVTVQLSGVVTIDANTGRKTVHNLNWNNSIGTAVLQSRTSRTSYGAIHTGSAPYSYIQPDLNTNYYYRLVVNGTTFSNEIILRSTRK